MRARQRHFTYKAAGAIVAYDARYLADSDGTALSTWPDRAGTYNATESGTKRPTVKTGANGINGATALDFDGTDDDLQAASVPLNTFITVVLCGSFTSSKPMLIEHGPIANNNNGFYFYGGNLNAWLFRRTSVNGAAGVVNWFASSNAIASLRYNGTGKYRKDGGADLSNGTITGSALANLSVTDNLNICSRNRASGFSDGLLGTLQIYNGAASDSLLRRLEHATAYSFKIACS